MHLPVVVCLAHDLLDFRITGFGLCGCCDFLFILGLCFISVAVAKKLWLLIGFAGLLPVFSCVLIDKWLIINDIHFCMLCAFAGWGSLSEPLIYLILLIHMKWVDMLVRCGHIWFIFHFRCFRFFAG
jgi:hypothetical protein